MTSALDLLMDSDSAAETTTLLESNGICTIDSRTRTIFVPPEIVVGAVQSDKNAERIKFSCPKIVGDNLDLSKFSIRINFENVSSADPDISIKDQYICEDASINEDNITFSWVIGKNAARYMGTIRFIVCAVKTDSNSNISIEWNTTVAQIPVLEGIEIDQPSLDENNKDVINQLLAITKTASDEAVKNVNSAKEQAITDIQNVLQPDKTLTVEGGIADAKATGNAISSLRDDLANLTSIEKSANIWDGSVYSDENGSKGYTLHPTTGLPFANDSFVLSDFIEINNTKEYSFYGLYLGTIVNPRINRFAFYDANKSLIGTVNSTGQAYHKPAEISRIACENGAKYLRFATLTGYKEYNIMLMEYDGTIPNEYIPYSVKKYLSNDVKVKAPNIDGEVKPNGYDKLVEQVNKSKEEIENINTIVIPDMVLPSVIPCIMGTPLNLYYRNLFRQSGDRMKCFLAKGKGNSYPRAYHYEPTSSQLQFELVFNYSDDLYISGKKSYSTQVKPVTVNGKPLNILIVGDSFTFMSYWQKGLYALLKSGGYTPTFIGRTGFTVDEMAECRSGAQMKHYTRDTAKGGTVKVVPSTPLTGKISSGALYSDGVNSYKYWVYAHNANLVEFGTFDGTVADLPDTGTFTLVSGTGPATIPYSSIIEYGCVNPFYNIDTRKLDFTQYASKWTNGKVPDVCILQFMLNDVKPWSNETAVEASITEYKAFINALHSDYPNCKVVISIEPMGAVYNGGASNYLQDDTNGGKYSQMIFAKRIIEEFDKNTSYGEYVWISASYAQVDCENGYELGEKVLSSRLPNVKDNYGVSSIHCSEDGMYMISDAVYPCVVDATN